MKLYKNYNQQQLDLQYNNRVHTPDFQTDLDKWDLLSIQANETLSIERDISYGCMPEQLLDIYPAAKPNSKTLVFLHGGYWHRFAKHNFRFVAAAFAPYNITTVIIGYQKMPHITMPQLISSTEQALSWVHINISNYNGNNQQIFVAGHSSGGHLASMLITKPSMQFIKGICTLSGLFNLIPIQLSDVNEALLMNTETAKECSPVLLKPVFNCPLIIAVGGQETNEYLAQSQEIFDCWQTQLQSVELLELKDLNHFSILSSITEGNELHKIILRMIGEKG
jgi:arylformamidase